MMPGLNPGHCFFAVWQRRHSGVHRRN